MGTAGTGADSGYGGCGGDGRYGRGRWVLRDGEYGRDDGWDGHVGRADGGASGCQWVRRRQSTRRTALKSAESGCGYVIGDGTGTTAGVNKG